MDITVPAFQYHFIGLAVEANRQRSVYCIRRETGAASAERGCLFLYSSIGGKNFQTSGHVSSVHVHISRQRTSQVSAFKGSAAAGGVAAVGSARRSSRYSDPSVRRKGLLFFSVQSDTIGPERHIVRCNEMSASEGRTEVAKYRKSVAPDLKRIIATMNLRERLACRVIIRY